MLDSAISPRNTGSFCWRIIFKKSIPGDRCAHGYRCRYSGSFQQIKPGSIICLLTYLIPSPVDLPDPGIELGSPALQEDSLPIELSRNPCWLIYRPISMFIPLSIHIFININLNPYLIYTTSVWQHDFPLAFSFFLLVSSFSYSGKK